MMPRKEPNPIKPARKSTAKATHHAVASIAEVDEEMMRELTTAMDAELTTARNNDEFALSAADLNGLAEAMDATSDTRFAQSQFRRERKKRRG